MLNDHRVYLIIKEELQKSSGATIREHLGSANDFIGQDREHFHQGDVDYAAAEHYLFSRWLIAWTGIFGVPFLAMAAGGYDLIKKLLPTSMIPQAGKGPVTPYTPGDVQWSRRGGADGLTDFKASYVGSRVVPQDPDDPL